MLVYFLMSLDVKNFWICPLTLLTEISARWQTLDAIEDYSYYEVWNEQDGWLNIGEKEVSILWNPDGIMVDNRKYYHEVWAGRVSQNFKANSPLMLPRVQIRSV